MKDILKKIITFILQIEARIVLKKYKPKIVAITGNVGKTTTKDAVYQIMNCFFYVRKSEKSFNSEIGIPLTVLGCENAWNNIVGWIGNIIEGLKLILLKNHYPDWLILEVGADRPGDIKQISKWLKPDIAVVTSIPDTPVHIEFFSSLEELIEEKLSLLKATKQGGAVILNQDDKNTIALSKKIDRKIITYGTSKEALFEAGAYNIAYKDNKPCGINFKVSHAGNTIPVSLQNLIGRQHISPILAAIAVTFDIANKKEEKVNINLLDISRSLENYMPAPGRMRLIEGIYKSTIIDDSYNSSPTALHEALKTLKDIEVKDGKKIAVLGDMLELGQYSSREHEKTGKKCAEVLDLLAIVGVRSKKIAKSAIENGMPEDKVFEFDNTSKANEEIKDHISSYDVVLIKGSQSMRMERVTEELITIVDGKEKILPRQESEWRKRIV